MGENNMKIAIIGSTSSLGKSIKSELDNLKIEYSSFSRKVEPGSFTINANDLSIESIKNSIVSDHNVYIFSLGFIQPKNILEQSEDEILSSMKINALYIIKLCEYIFNTNEFARVFIIGSESGRKGSYDTSYFLSKSMLRSYVRQRQVSQKQQLLLISPSTIEDSKMTVERTDLDTLEKYRHKHPKGRFLYMSEVTKYLIDLILNPSTYITNTEIEINGGKFCRM